MLSNLLKRSFGKKKPQIPFKNWKITKGDMVQVIRGKDEGKVGEVLKVMRKQNRVIVDGVNIVMKRKKGDEQGESIGGVKPILAPLHISRVNLVDPTTGEATKVAIGYLEDGTKVRVSKTTGTIIEKPDRSQFTYENRVKNKVDGPLDTQADLVLEVTYQGEDFGLIRDDFEQFIQEKEDLEELLVFDK